MQPSLFLVPVVFPLTGHDKSCACLSYAVSAAPRPPRTAGVSVGPFFRKQETFLLCHETLRRGEEGAREKNPRRSILVKEEQMFVNAV